MLKRLILAAAFALLLITPTFGATYVLNSDGTVTKQDDAPKKACDCGCAVTGHCDCGDCGALPFVQANADVWQMQCGPNGCQVVPISATATAGPTATVTTSTTYADAGTNVVIVGSGRGHRRHHILPFLFPRVAAVHQSRIANGTALIAPTVVPAQYAAQGYAAMPVGPAAVTTKVPLTAAQQKLELQRGVFLELLRKYGVGVIKLMPEIAPVVLTHGWTIFENPAFDLWIVSALQASANGLPIPPMPPL